MNSKSNKIKKLTSKVVTLKRNIGSKNINWDQSGALTKKTGHRKLTAGNINNIAQAMIKTKTKAKMHA